MLPSEEGLIDEHAEMQTMLGNWKARSRQRNQKEMPVVQGNGEREMSMHFEPEKGHGTYSVIELRTDTRLAAQIRATRDGVVIDVAEGFEFANFRDSDASEIHVSIRERES